MKVPIKTYEEMTRDEQRQHLLDLFEESLVFFFDGGDGGKEISPEKFLKMMGFKQRIRRPKNGAYVTSKWLAERVGCDAETIRKKFGRRRDGDGVKKQTYSGRNRKPYTVLRISKVAAKKEFPDLEI